MFLGETDRARQRRAPPRATMCRIANTESPSLLQQFRVLAWTRPSAGVVNPL
jgi:hypothetical protein